MARRGEAHPGLGRRSKLERDLKEGEAELRARAIGEWRGGAGARRRRSSSAARAELGARGSGGRKGSAGGVKAERVRLAAGRAPLQARQRAAWSELAGRVVDTRRASPDAVRTWRGDGTARGRRRRGARRQAGLARRGAGPRRGARGGFAGPACGAGPKARRRPAKEKNSFFHLYFQEFF